MRMEYELLNLLHIKNLFRSTHELDSNTEDWVKLMLAISLAILILMFVNDIVRIFN